MVIEVVDWINYNFESESFDISVSGSGGWFNFDVFALEGEQNSFGHRWQDLLDIYDEEYYPYLEAIRESVLENTLKLNGSQHENSDHGVPLFNDNTICILSWRAWGDLMAAIWSEFDNKDYTYMEFYC